MIIVIKCLTATAFMWLKYDYEIEYERNNGR